MAPRMERSASRFCGRGRSRVGPAAIGAGLVFAFSSLYSNFVRSAQERSVHHSFQQQNLRDRLHELCVRMWRTSTGVLVQILPSGEKVWKKILRELRWHDNASTPEFARNPEGIMKRNSFQKTYSVSLFAATACLLITFA